MIENGFEVIDFHFDFYYNNLVPLVQKIERRNNNVFYKYFVFLDTDAFFFCLLCTYSLISLCP